MRGASRDVIDYVGGADVQGLDAGDLLVHTVVRAAPPSNLLMLIAPDGQPRTKLRA